MSKSKLVVVTVVCVIVLIVCVGIVYVSKSKDKTTYDDYGSNIHTRVDTEYDGISLFINDTPTDEMQFVVDYFNENGITGIVVASDFNCDVLSDFLLEYKGVVDTWYGIDGENGSYEAVVVDGQVILSESD